MPKGRFAEDLSGKRYGKIVVVKREPSLKYNNGRTVAMFLCRCDCGVEKVISATRLRTGKVTSCGCEPKETKRGHHIDDLTGQRFGRWIVLYRVESKIEPSGNKTTRWHCKCDCGTERDLSAGTLKSGSSRSCGCLKREIITKARDLTGQRFGRWTAIEKGKPYVASNGRQYRTWHCKCDCGTESDVTEMSLLSNKSVSCGCYRLEKLRESCYHDFTGKTFGELTVIKRLPDRHTVRGNRIQEWLCHCSCGTDVIRSRSNLASGFCTSCGHDKAVSSLEVHTEQYLNEHCYTYEKQKRYCDLFGPGGLPLSYDFLVFKNDGSCCLIECQGRQHYEPVDYFGGEKGFELQQIRDKLKADYAVNHNINLIEIPYYYNTYDAVSTLLDEIL